MKTIGTQWKIVEKVKDLKATDHREDWKVTYATPIYGGWDIIVECVFSNLEDLYKIVAFCRYDEELSQLIETTTTLLSMKKDYPNSYPKNLKPKC